MGCSGRNGAERVVSEDGSAGGKVPKRVEAGNARLEGIRSKASSPKLLKSSETRKVSRLVYPPKQMHDGFRS